MVDLLRVCSGLKGSDESGLDGEAERRERVRVEGESAPTEEKREYLGRESCGCGAW